MTSFVEAFFGLRKPAFTVNKSSGPVLMTGPLRTTANFLCRRLDQGSEILCVSGPPGIGKSSVARALSKLTGSRFRIATMSGRAKCWNDLCGVLVREFGIAEGRITRDGLADARAKFGKLLIVVDDAQFLTPKLLERICILPQLRTDDALPVVQVILFADFGGVPLDEIRPLRAWFDIDAHQVMEPLPATDIHRYIDKRLRQVGWTSEPLFSESGAQALHRLSLGNPRRLSAACMGILEHAAERGLTLIDAALVLEFVGTTEESEAAEPLSTSSAGAVLRDGLGDGSSDGLAGGLIPETRPKLRKAERRSVQRAVGETHPLKTENIAAVPSLELAEFTHGASGANQIFAPMESMRCVANRAPVPMTEYVPFRLHSHRKGTSPKLLAFCVLLATFALYTL